MIEIGDKGTVEWIVERRMLAKEMGSGDLDVFSTPSCVALLEKAACTVLLGKLEEGATTVGTRMELNHMAATPEGMRVRGEAVLTAVEGRKYTFTVTAYDEKEKIAEGTHERFAVRSERFTEKANAKRTN